MDIRTQTVNIQARYLMQRLIFWIRKSVRNRNDCRCFCVTCKYYEICRNDGGFE